jgi:hypothetical protein
MKSPTRRLVRALALGLVFATVGAAASGATSWVVTLHSNSAGEGQSQALPAAPAGLAAACNSPTTSKTITVTWNTVAHATTYSVYDSTTSPSGTYSLAAGGVTTNAWASGTLAKGNYWFEVTASIGSSWASTMSSASGESIINAKNPFCVQP